MLRAPGIHLLLASVTLVTACDLGEPEPRRVQGVDYRNGTATDDFRTSGERGSIIFTEMNWAGSMEETADGFVHHPDDVFLELRNQYFRPVHLTGWQIELHLSNGRDPIHRQVEDPDDSTYFTFIIPERENGRPVDPGEYIVIAARRDGAFREADYYLEDLRLAGDGFGLLLRDIDDRLIDQGGNIEREAFAGSYDLTSTRSMERVQLIFANRGDRESSFHSYSSNPWDALHERLARRIHPDFRARTLASPGVANSIDYSGNTSAGTFE